MTGNGVLTRAHEFRDKIRPMSRAQQLVWLGNELGISDVQILSLIGYKKSEIENRKNKSLEELAISKPDETIWVTEILRELASRYNYNSKELSKVLASRYGMVFSAKASALGDISGFSQKTTESNMLSRIWAGGPTVFSDFIKYIQLTGSHNVDHITDRRKKDKRRT